MASPGRSMGLVLHDEEGMLEDVRLIGVGEGVGVEICVVRRGEYFVVEHLVGRGRLPQKQVDASSCTVFFVEDARSRRVKSSGHTELDGVLLQLQHPG
jgi:hypothetical protein